MLLNRNSTESDQLSMCNSCCFKVAIVIYQGLQTGTAGASIRTDNNPISRIQSMVVVYLSWVESCQRISSDCLYCGAGQCSTVNHPAASTSSCYPVIWAWWLYCLPAHNFLLYGQIHDQNLNKTTTQCSMAPRPQIDWYMMLMVTMTWKAVVNV